MKETQTGSGFRQCTRTVPVREVNLLPQQRQRHLGTPAVVEPSLQAPPPASRAFRVRPIGRGGLGERAEADLIAAAPLVDGFSGQLELVGGEARHDGPEGVRSSHMDLSRPPERPPGGIVAKQRSGWALGQILCSLGRAKHSGALRSLNHHLLSILLDYLRLC